MLSDAQRTPGLEYGQDFQDLNMALTESLVWLARGQNIDNFLARLPHLPASVVGEIEQCVREPEGREELVDILFQWTYPGLYKIRKAAGGVDLLCDGIGLLVKRREQSPDSPATVMMVVLVTLMFASPWILLSLLVWVFIGPVVWWRKNHLKRRVESAMKTLPSDNNMLDKSAK
jgi:hypothetical protein